MAYAILLNEGTDILCLLVSNIYGAFPNWLVDPNHDLILPNPPMPKSAAEFEAQIAAFVKGIRGK